MSKKIEMKISPAGEVEISTEGYKGKSCLDVTKALETALGTTVDRKATKEMTERETKTQVKAKI